MKLARWMARNGLDDEAMAKAIRDYAQRNHARTAAHRAGSKCDRSAIYRWRKEQRRPEWPMILIIAAVTEQGVTADDWMELEGVNS